MKERVIKLLKNEVQNDFIAKLGCLYLLVPFMLFSLFWLEWYWAILVCAVSLFLCYNLFFNKGNAQKRDCIIHQYNLKKALCILGIIAIWILLSGIGKLAYQNDDHVWRNTMFETLCNYRWPVTGWGEVDGIVSERGFSYYIGFWIPAAFVGKLFGVNAGYMFQVIWAILGVCIFYYKVCEKLNKVVIWPLIVFIMFSGMDCLGAYLAGLDVTELTHTLHLEWWCGSLQFSSFTTQLFWVFNQAIPAWLATILIMTEKNNKKIFLIFSATILNGAIPAIGLIPFLILRILYPKYHKNERFTKSWWKYLCKDICTLENIIGGGVIGVISSLYLARDMGSMTSLFRDLSNGGWMIWILFIGMEIGGTVICCYFAQKKNPWFWTAIIWLIICPLLQLYGESNFCMRASIPGLVVIYFCIILSLQKFYAKDQKKYLIPLLIVLVIGSATPIHEVNRTIAETKKRYWAEQSIEATALTVTDVLSNQYESVDVSESFFFKYLAQNKEK